VAAFVEATARILVRDGFDRASTNRIAEEAGFSIGSLYQYFPGKEALVAAVIERHNRDLIAVVQSALSEGKGEPLEAGVRKLVAAAIDAHRIDPLLHRVLAEQTPRAGGIEGVELFHRQAFALFRAFLEDHREEVRASDLDLANYICVTSIEALTHNAVILHTDGLPTQAAETLATETTRLITDYLRGEPRVPRALID
jgi:AcrR family transcriptional regulator